MASLATQLGMPVRRVQRVSVVRPRQDAVSVVAATLLATLVGMYAAASDAELRHWFLLPVCCCGAVIGVDLMEWLRGRMDLFDPAGMIGLLGFHFFMVAPLLMIHSGYRMKYLPEQPADYRTWLGLMAMLNFVGLVLYRKALASMWTEDVAKQAARQVSATRWRIKAQRFWIVWTFLVAASIALEAYTIAIYGGISGYVAAYSAWLGGGGDSFEGMALLFAVSESLPILLLIAYCYWAHRKWVPLWMTVAAFVLFMALDMLIGGLRGSRSNVIWTIFWGAGIVHLYVRKIPRLAAMGSLVVLYGFVSIYAAYKQHGAQLLNDISTSGGYSSVNDGAEDSATVLVGDFSRTDVQANLIWRMTQNKPIQYAWGQTYLGAATMLIPRSAWPGRPPTIVRWTTDAEYGNGAFLAGLMHSTRVYGIAGEAMLNVGPAGVPLALMVLGLGVGWLRRFTRSLDKSDARLILVPFLVNLGFLALLNDSDNLVFYLVKYGLVPCTLIWLSSQRIQRRVLPCRLSSVPRTTANHPFRSTSTVPRRSTSTMGWRSTGSR